MVKLEQIMTAINAQLLTLGVEINENDVKQGFDRPSIFVKFDTSYRTDYQHSFLRELTILIYYFPSDRYRYQIEVMDMQQKIEALFKTGLEVEDRYIKIAGDTEADVNEGVLQMSFELSFYDVDEGAGEVFTKMEGLDFNG